MHVEFQYAEGMFDVLNSLIHKFWFESNTSSLYSGAFDVSETGKDGESSFTLGSH